MTKLDGAVRLLRMEHDRLAKQMRGISAALSAFGAAYGKRTTSRKMSAAGRARIAEAQRLRWAKAKGTSGPTKSAVAAPEKRTMSAAASGEGNSVAELHLAQPIRNCPRIESRSTFDPETE